MALRHYRSGHRRLPHRHVSSILTAAPRRYGCQSPETPRVHARSYSSVSDSALQPSKFARELLNQDAIGWLEEIPESDRDQAVNKNIGEIQHKSERKTDSRYTHIGSGEGIAKARVKSARPRSSALDILPRGDPETLEAALADARGKGAWPLLAQCRVELKSVRQIMDKSRKNVFWLSNRLSLLSKKKISHKAREELLWQHRFELGELRLVLNKTRESLWQLETTVARLPTLVAHDQEPNDDDSGEFKWRASKSMQRQSESLAGVVTSSQKSLEMIIERAKHLSTAISESVMAKSVVSKKQVSERSTKVSTSPEHALHRDKDVTQHSGYGLHKKAFQTMWTSHVAPHRSLIASLLQALQSPDRRRSQLLEKIDERLPNLAQVYPGLHNGFAKMLHKPGEPQPWTDVKQSLTTCLALGTEMGCSMHHSRKFTSATRFKPQTHVHEIVRSLQWAEFASPYGILEQKTKTKISRLRLGARLRLADYRRRMTVLRSEQVSYSQLFLWHAHLARLRDLESLQTETLEEKRLVLLIDPMLERLRQLHKVTILSRKALGNTLIKQILYRVADLIWRVTQIARERIEMESLLGFSTPANTARVDSGVHRLLRIEESRVQESMANLARVLGNVSAHDPAHTTSKRRTVHDASAKTIAEQDEQRHEMHVFEDDIDEVTDMTPLWRLDMTEEHHEEEEGETWRPPSTELAYIGKTLPKVNRSHVSLTTIHGRSVVPPGWGMFDSTARRQAAWNDRSRDIEWEASDEASMAQWQSVDRDEIDTSRGVEEAPSETSSNISSLGGAHQTQTRQLDQNDARQCEYKIDSHAPPAAYDSSCPESIDTVAADAEMTPAVSYQLQLPDDTSKTYWSHRLYRNADGSQPRIHYCTTFEQAEVQARLFHNVSVIGFDMEWEMAANANPNPIKNNISLIQIASEERIGLFHIASFRGNTVDELMPPSLRKILESADIAKAGVNIAGDATRLRRWLNVDFHGTFELSHLYKVVRYSVTRPEDVNRRVLNMAAQIEGVFDLPLLKDPSVRMSNWSRRLAMDQVEYAAADAYAGVQLYLTLDRERCAMRPRPPRPAYHELCQPLILGNGDVIEYKSPRKRRVNVGGRAVMIDEDADEEYFDALEEQEGDDLEEIVAAVAGLEIDGSTAGNEGTREASSSSLAGKPPSEQDQTSDKVKETKPEYAPVPVPPALVKARRWVSEYRRDSDPEYVIINSNRRLEIWHLWHHQELGLAEIAKMARQPPLSHVTVASYVVTVVKETNLPYRVERMKEAFEYLPASIHGRYPEILARIRG